MESSLASSGYQGSLRFANDMGQSLHTGLEAEEDFDDLSTIAEDSEHPAVPLDEATEGMESRDGGTQSVSSSRR